MSNAARPSSKTFPKTRLALAISALLSPALLPSQALAAPTGGVVTTGAANIVQSGSITDINQSSHKATINWHSFSTAASETVNFNQPNAASVTLNRVTGNEQSVLNGALNANGQVFLLNSNGVLIGKGARINTAGFVASTLGLSDADFESGHYHFQTNGSPGTLINLGTITIKDGGYAALLGQSVTNQGVIVANKGTVSLNSGKRITLNFNGDSLLNVSIDEGSLNALVENKQAIQADGGKVILTAKAAGELLNSQVNNTGVIQAQTLDDVTGSIELFAHGGTATINGTLDASATISGNGGFIETSGETVKIADGATITTTAQNGKTGTWLIDPTDFTIGSGGDITGAQLSSSLANSNVVIESIKGKQQGKGDIHIFEAVSWQNTTLTLNAENDIHINNALTINGENGQLVMNTGADGDYHIRTKASYSGAVLDANGKPVAKQDTSGGVYGSITFTHANNKNGLTINNNTYTLIHSMDELASISGIRGHYALARNPQGGTHAKAVVDVLDGTFAGLGHVIDGLSILIPDIDPRPRSTGLFATSQGGSFIRDIGLENATIDATGVNFGAGVLVGSNLADIHQAYSTGTITGSSVGGLIGRHNLPENAVETRISSSSSSVTVRGSGASGGLIARINSSSAGKTVISNSHATGSVITISRLTAGAAGGLIGLAYAGDILNSYASGNVGDMALELDAAGGLSRGGITRGGLIGEYSVSKDQVIQNSFASGDVYGRIQLGGLMGNLSVLNGSFLMDNSYATGSIISRMEASTNVSTYTGVGGLIGYVYNDRSTLEITIRDVHATGDVNFIGTHGRTAGGLIGMVTGTGRTTIDSSYATGNVTASVESNASQFGNMGGLIGVSAGSQTLVKDSYATGDVVGNRQVGGLIGSNSGSIVNSWASGNVNGLTSVGGLAGSVGNGGFITNAYAIGEVHSRATEVTTARPFLSVGGLVGLLNGGEIHDSWASGQISSAASDPTLGVGGVVGRGMKGHVSNSYYNASLNAGLDRIGDVFPDGVFSPGATIDNRSGGLTTQQFADLAYYLDGTIEQVLADRAEAAVQAEAAAEAARLEAEAAAVRVRLGGAGQQTDNLVQTQTQQTIAATLPTIQFVSASLALIDSQIVVVNPPEFSAEIRNVDVGGSTYEVNRGNQE